MKQIILTPENFEEQSMFIQDSMRTDEKLNAAYEFIKKNLWLKGETTEIDKALNRSFEFINNYLKKTQFSLITPPEKPIEKPVKEKKVKPVKPIVIKEPKQKKERKKKIPIYETKQVENIDEQIYIINRYIELDKKQTTREALITLLNALQKRVRIHLIRQTGKYAKEIEHIQNELINLIAQAGTGKFLFSLDAKDKELLIPIAKSETVIPSITLIKSFILIQGKKGEQIKKRAKNLLSKIYKANILDQDKYYNQIYNITISLQNFVDGKTTSINITEQTLNGLLGIIDGINSKYVLYNYFQDTGKLIGFLSFKKKADAIKNAKKYQKTHPNTYWHIEKI